MYAATLIESDGRLIGEAVLELPVRYIHLIDDGDPVSSTVMLSDEPDPVMPDEFIAAHPHLATAHRTTYRRLGSAVWVDDAGNARFFMYERLV